MHPFDARYFRDTNYSEPLYLRKVELTRHTKFPVSINYTQIPPNMQKLRDLLLTKESAEKAISILTSVEATQTDKTQYIDFLEILFGRITQIQEAGEVGRTVEDEVQQIVQFAVTDISSAKHDGVREALLDIISYMPCRTENEIKSVLKLIQGTTDARIQEACANALAHASPQTPEARAIIESEKQSNIEAIRKAVNTFIHFSSFPNSDNFEQA